MILECTHTLGPSIKIWRTPVIPASGTQEAGSGGLWAQGQLGVCCEFQTNRDYIGNCCLQSKWKRLLGSQDTAAGCSFQVRSIAVDDSLPNSIFQNIMLASWNQTCKRTDASQNWRIFTPQKIQLLRFARTQQFPIFRLSDPVHLIWRFSFLPGSWEVRILLLREPHLENHLEERLSEPWVRQLILLSWPNCESSSTKSILEGRRMPKNVTGDQYQIDVTRS